MISAARVFSRWDYVTHACSKYFLNKVKRVEHRNKKIARNIHTETVRDMSKICPKIFLEVFVPLVDRAYIYDNNLAYTAPLTTLFSKTVRSRSPASVLPQLRPPSPCRRCLFSFSPHGGVACFSPARPLCFSPHHTPAALPRRRFNCRVSLAFTSCL